MLIPFKSDQLYCQDAKQKNTILKLTFQLLYSQFLFKTFHLARLIPTSLQYCRYRIHMAASPPPSSTGSAKLDGLVQKASANTPEKLSGLALYSRFALAGAICCSVTHGGLTPVDV